MIQDDERARFQQQVAVDRLVDLALNIFDKYEEGGREEAEQRLRSYSGDQVVSLDRAVERLQKLAAEYPQDSIAARALEWLREIRESIPA